MDIQNSDIGTLIIVPSSGTVKEKMVIEGIRRRRQIDDFSLESKDECAKINLGYKLGEIPS